MMPIAPHLRNLKQALGTYRRALEEFESALLEFEETPVCEVCGEALRDTRRDANTCSAACRQEAYRRRAQHLSIPKAPGKALTRHPRRPGPLASGAREGPGLGASENPRSRKLGE
jgi:hypothetical protein